MIAHIDFLSTAFNLPKTPLFSRYFKLYTAFFISALIHFSGDCMMLQSSTAAVGALRFFCSQALIITFETALALLASRLGLSTASWWTRALGYVWVIGWFSCSLPWWIEPHVRVGFVDSGRYDSVIGSLAHRALSILQHGTTG